MPAMGIVLPPANFLEMHRDHLLRRRITSPCTRAPSENSEWAEM
jgi:hypothetical protein